MSTLPLTFACICSQPRSSFGSIEALDAERKFAPYPSYALSVPVTYDGVTNDELPAPRQVEDGPRSLSAPELEVRDFEALGDVARPRGVETLFDGSFGPVDTGDATDDGREDRARGA